MRKPTAIAASHGEIIPDPPYCRRLVENLDLWRVVVWYEKQRSVVFQSELREPAEEYFHGKRLDAQIFGMIVELVEPGPGVVLLPQS